MQVFLDDQKLDVAAPPAPTLARALAAARDLAERQGRVIVEATHDGMPIATEHLEEASPTSGGSTSSSVAFHGEVRFVSAEPRSLVKVTWQDVAEALRRTEADQTKAAELLHMGKLEEAMEYLGASLGVWENVRQAVLNGAALVGLDLETVVIDQHHPDKPSMTVAERVGGLVEHLQNVKRAIQAQDWSSLADTLEYELCEESRLWQRVLTQMAGAIRISSDGE